MGNLKAMLHQSHYQRQCQRWMMWSVPMTSVNAMAGSDVSSDSVQEVASTAQTSVVAGSNLAPSCGVDEFDGWYACLQCSVN